MRHADKLEIRTVTGGAALKVKVVPGSSRDKIVGVLGDALKVATSAPPEKGKANKAVAAMLATALGVDTRSITLQAGASSAHKEFTIAGLNASDIRARLSGH